MKLRYQCENCLKIETREAMVYPHDGVCSSCGSTGLVWVDNNRTPLQAYADLINEFTEEPKGALSKQVGGGHYKDMPLQPIEYILANELGFCEGNIVKYITRYKAKGGAEDVKKVIHYAQILLENIDGGS